MDLGSLTRLYELEDVKPSLYQNPKKKFTLHESGGSILDSVVNMEERQLKTLIDGIRKFYNITWMELNF